MIIYNQTLLDLNRSIKHGVQTFESTFPKSRSISATADIRNMFSNILKRSSATPSVNYAAIFGSIVGVILFIVILYYLFPVLLSCCPSLVPPSLYGYKERKTYDFSDLEAFDLSPKTSRNFYIKSEEDGTSLGIWQVLPHETDLSGGDLTDTQFEKRLDDGTPIFIYFHGVTSNRAVDYRVAVLKLISRLGYHALTLDYRGFGDSGGEPEDELDVVTDAISLVRYIRQHAAKSTLILWGHSMGSGVTGSVYKKLQDEGQGEFVQGIFLEGAFNKFSSAIHRHRYTKPFKGVIGIYKMLNHMLHSCNIEFNSVENLSNATVPISIAHSEDDNSVAFELGVRLYEGLRAAGRSVTFKDLGKHNYCHCYNFKSPELPGLVTALVEKAEANKNGTGATANPKQH